MRGSTRAERTLGIALAFFLPSYCKNGLAFSMRRQPLLFERLIIALPKQSDTHDCAGDDRLTDQAATKLLMHRKHGGRGLAKATKFLGYEQPTHAKLDQTIPCGYIKHAAVLARTALGSRPVVCN